MKKFTLPLDVPPHAQETFTRNYQALTRDTGSLVLMAADQKVEHLLQDFYGPQLAPEVSDPAHVFTIARAGYVGALATQLGLIARYGQNDDHINYIVKLNSKTNLLSTAAQDPRSSALWSIEQVVHLKHTSKLNICGIGYTVYLGSSFEAEMLREAAQLIYEAHQHGLLAILWMYPRGNAISNERDGALIAGAAGVGLCLGADFVKINVPEDDLQHNRYEWLRIAQKTAQPTRIICSGGPQQTPENFLHQVYQQIHMGNIAGCAVGRNIFQHPTLEAIAITCALSKIVYERGSLQEALRLLDKSLR